MDTFSEDNGLIFILPVPMLIVAIVTPAVILVWTSVTFLGEVELKQHKV